MSLINKSGVRNLALSAANARRERIRADHPAAAPPFTAVGAAFLDEIEAEFRRLVERRACEYWQKGVTLQ